jgi:hypothetical protein
VSKKAEKDGGTGKKKAKDEKGQAAGASVANHPRARASVRRAKGWGGLIGFGIAAYLSFQAGVPAPAAGLRALGAGLAGYILAWACAVAVWRHLVVAEMRAAYERGALRPAPGTAGASGAQAASGTPAASGSPGSSGGGATGGRR